MNVIEALGLLVIALIVMILILFSIKNDIYLSVRSFCVLFLVFTAAIAVMVYNLDPRESIRWDLLVHYDTLEQMRTRGLEYVLHESEYKSLFLINWYFYLIALIGDNKLLSVFPVIIDFLCALYMIQDQLKLRYGKSAPIRDCALIAGMWFMSYGFMLSISGVRCVLAMAMGVLGLYLEYYKREHRAFGVFLYIAALMTHSMGAAIPLIRILLKVKNKLLVQITMIAACLLFSPVATVLGNVIGITYLRYLLTNLAKYWRLFGTVRWFLWTDNASRTVFLSYVMICIFYVYMVQIIKQKQFHSPETAVETNPEYRAWNLCSTISILYVTSMFNRLFTERLTYILGFSMAFIVPMYLQSVERNWKRMVLHGFMLLIFLWLFFFNDLYIFIVNFTGVYFLDL